MSSMTDPTTWVELDPELADCLRETKVGKMVKHPLVVSGYHPFMAESLNQMLQGKREAASEYLASKNWSGYLFLYERMFRVYAFLTLSERVDVADEDYWDLLRSLWEDTENSKEWRHMCAEFFGDERPGRERLMSEHEREGLAAMADRLTVFRGTTSLETDRGWSWTLDREKAEWFAQRFAGIHGSPVLHHGKANRDDVVMYVEVRGEEELVIDPTHVRVFRTTKLPIKEIP